MDFKTSPGLIPDLRLWAFISVIRTKMTESTVPYPDELFP